jgi:predicted metal-dependent phosphoesterase TrpH
VIDLHTHSVQSDGSDAPARVAELAALARCSAFALTDHDTLIGQAEAARRAAELGVELVPGCEVSCAFAGTSAHILCYFVTDREGPLQDELARLRGDRVARNKQMVERLNSLGIPVTYDELLEQAGGEENAGRPHFAELLVRHGAADSVPDAFERWLASGQPAYIPKARVTPEQVAGLARDSGGVAVLAHPFTLGLEPRDLERAVTELAASGLTGLESYYGRYTHDQRSNLADLARRTGLVATGGSDYHGTTKPDLSVGTGRGDLKVPDSVLDNLVARRPG